MRILLLIVFLSINYFCSFSQTAKELIEKDEPLTLNNRGLPRYHLKDYIGALDDINKSPDTYPTNSYAYKNRALVYLAMKENDKACADIKTAIDKGFTEMYGNEIIDLQNANCPGK